MKKKDNDFLKKLLYKLSRWYKCFRFGIANIKKRIPDKFSKQLARFLLILVASVTVVFVFLNRDNLSPDQVMTWASDKIVTFGVGPDFPSHIVGNKVSDKNFKLLDGNVAVVSDTAFVCLNGSAKEIASRQHGFSNPTLKVNSNKALIYDLYGTGLAIESKSTEIYKTNKKDNILSAAVACNGIYGTVTQTKGFTGKLELFHSCKNESFYEYCFSDCYITDMAINKNGKSISTVGVTSKNGGMISNLYIFDGKSENAKLKLDFPDSMLFSVSYLSNGNVVVLGDNILSVVNTSNGKKHDYLFENRALTAFDVNEDKGILLSLSLSDDGNSCELLLFDKKGNLEKNIKTDLKIKAVSYNYDRITAVCYGYTYVYKKNGKALGKYDSGKDAKEIILFSPKGAYVLGFTEIRKILF
ncbi:MAG: hypothetical protein RUMPE_00447 [Eubacteriales bacterium SKADARSKE-1]|nr:hypothetical protein [Eubacteriales bacterium SKADARSKE-1]